jgi:hypothetical protein
MADSVVVRDLGWKAIKKEMEKFRKGPHARVGVLASAGGYGGDGKVTVANVATWMEFGVKIPVTDAMRGFLAANGLRLKKETTIISIPARPFMAQAFDTNRAQLEAFIDTQAGRVLSGQISEEQGLALIGLFFESKVQEIFEKGEFAANSAFTIAQKGSDKPLINEGILRKSISSEVLQSDKK